MNEAKDGSTGLPKYGTGISDLIDVELHNASDYATIEHTLNNVNLNTSGTCDLSVPAEHNGSYYITVRHRNSIVTTTSIPVSFAGGTISYSFTSNASKAYGNNLKEVSPEIFAIYSGDSNEDGVIDQVDIDTVISDASLFSTGFYATDINGDGVVDALDSIITENNAALFVAAVTP